MTDAPGTKAILASGRNCWKSARAEASGVLVDAAIIAGEMTVREEARGLLLPTAIFARWLKS